MYLELAVSYNKILLDALFVYFENNLKIIYWLTVQEYVCKIICWYIVRDTIIFESENDIMMTVMRTYLVPISFLLKKININSHLVCYSTIFFAWALGNPHFHKWCSDLKKSYFLKFILGKDFVCVQSMDGTLSIFEQESFAFNRFLPGALLPGPIQYIPRIDSFITVSSSWQVECYK